MLLSLVSIVADCIWPGKLDVDVEKAPSTKMSSNNVNTYLSKIQNNFPHFRFSNIPVKTVALTVKCLKVSKSTGLDKIPAKVLKIASSIIAPSLTFTSCLIYHFPLEFLLVTGKLRVCARSIKAMTVVIWGIIDLFQSCQ